MCDSLNIFKELKQLRSERDMLKAECERLRKLNEHMQTYDVRKIVLVHRAGAGKAQKTEFGDEQIIEIMERNRKDNHETANRKEDNKEASSAVLHAGQKRRRNDSPVHSRTDTRSLQTHRQGK